MAVKTSPFTGWKLSGKVAAAFQKQVCESQPNERAQAALMRGRALCKQITEKGYSSVKPIKESFMKKACGTIKRIFAK